MVQAVVSVKSVNDQDIDIDEETYDLVTSEVYRLHLKMVSPTCPYRINRVRLLDPFKEIIN